MKWFGKERRRKARTGGDWRGKAWIKEIKKIKKIERREEAR